MTNRENKSRVDELVMKVYGDQIAAYACGSVALGKGAVHVSIPVIAALTMPEEYGEMYPRPDSAPLRRHEDLPVTVEPTLTATGT